MTFVFVVVVVVVLVACVSRRTPSKPLDILAVIKALLPI